MWDCRYESCSARRRGSGQTRKCLLSTPCWCQSIRLPKGSMHQLPDPSTMTAGHTYRILCYGSGAHQSKQASAGALLRVGCWHAVGVLAYACTKVDAQVCKGRRASAYTDLRARKTIPSRCAHTCVHMCVYIYIFIYLFICICVASILCVYECVCVCVRVSAILPHMEAMGTRWCHLNQSCCKCKRSSGMVVVGLLCRSGGDRTAKFTLATLRPYHVQRLRQSSIHPGMPQLHDEAMRPLPLASHKLAAWLQQIFSPTLQPNRYLTFSKAKHFLPGLVCLNLWRNSFKARLFEVQKFAKAAPVIGNCHLVEFLLRPSLRPHSLLPLLSPSDCTPTTPAATRARTNNNYYNVPGNEGRYLTKFVSQSCNLDSLAGCKIGAQNHLHHLGGEGRGNLSHLAHLALHHLRHLHHLGTKIARLARLAKSLAQKAAVISRHNELLITITATATATSTTTTMMTTMTHHDDDDFDSNSGSDHDYD